MTFQTNAGKAIVLKYSHLSILIEVLGWLLIMAVLLTAVGLYPGIEQFPTDFSEGGEVTGWTVREVAMARPIYAVIIFVIITGLGVIIRRAAPPDTPCPRLCAVLNVLQSCKLVYLAYTLVAVWYELHLMPVPTFLLPIALMFCAALAVGCTVYLLRISSKGRSMA
ncbi:MAG: hypothetical protein ACI4PC_00095 [Oscillospiraceae bacterium]